MIVALLDFKRAPDDWWRRAQALADEVDALIVRAKEESAARQWELAKLAAGLSCPVWLADRADVARAAGLAGVHLPEDGLAPAAVRSWWPQAHVSKSVHAVPRPEQTEGADLLVFGHLFATRSKPGLAPRGLEDARRVTAAAGCPVLGIGGVSAERIPLLAGTGLGGVVAADALFNAPDPRQAARTLKAAWARLAARESGREDAT